MIKVDGFVEFYVHWYFSYSVKRATKLKLRDRRTLPASLVSYAGIVLSLLWPNKSALIFCCLRRELTNTKLWESALWDSTSNHVWATATKRWQGQSHCTGTLNKQFLMDALSSVSEQAMKRAKNQPFLLLGLTSEIQLRWPHLE